MAKIIWHCLEALAAPRRRVNRRRQKACLVWLTNQVFGAGCGKQASKSLRTYVLLKEAVVVLGCRFCVPRAINTVLDPLYVLLIRDPTPLLKTAAVYPP
jgi:hypothetical protein